MSDESNRIARLEADQARLDQWQKDHELYSNEAFLRNDRAHKKLHDILVSVDTSLDVLTRKVFRYDYIALGIGLAAGVVIGVVMEAKNWLVNGFGH